MPLPFSEWLEIVSGPGTWKIINALFRDKNEDADSLRAFTVVEEGYPRKYEFWVIIEKVHRLPSKQYKYMIRGFLEEPYRSNGHLAICFTAHYNPETRKGLFKLEGERDES